MLLSDAALQNDCLLVYCAMAWRTRVFMCMCVNIFSSKSRFVIDCLACSKCRVIV